MSVSPESASDPSYVPTDCTPSFTFTEAVAVEPSPSSSSNSGVLSLTSVIVIVTVAPDGFPDASDATIVNV